MNILVQPQNHRRDQKSCNYTCPVYNTGRKGLKKLIKKLVRKKYKNGKHRGRVCWYGN